MMQKSAIQRGQPNASEPRKTLAQRWCEEIKKAKKKYDCGPFKQMREDMNFAYYGASESWYKADKYIANIIQSHIRQKVSALYAKNPRAVAQPAKKLNFKLWDGTLQAVTTAVETMFSNPLDVNAVALLDDIQKGKLSSDSARKFGETLEIVYHYYQGEQTPHFKGQMKQMVRRAITTGVGYVEIGFQREMGPSPILERKLGDYKQRLERLELIQADMGESDFSYSDRQAEIEELRLILQSLPQEEIVLRNGLVFDFPGSTQIIVDTRCRQLKGYIGAGWAAKENLMTVDEIKSSFKKDVTGNYMPYRANGIEYVDPRTGGSLSRNMQYSSDANCNLVRVWVLYDRVSGLVYYLADGYPDFLTEPAPPELKFEQFFPWFPLTLNDVENEKEIFPPSDVRLLRHMQLEVNRSRDELIKQRKANRPKYATPAGALEDEDKRKLENHQSGAVLSLRGLKPGQSVDALLQEIKMKGIDPNLYDTSPIMDDFMRVGGAQEANLGGTSNSTATESSIAESSRLSSVESNVDDLDDLLTEVVRASGQILCEQLDVQTVEEIVGPGFFWPQLSISELMKEVTLEIEAGSSGKPNRVLELANFERMMPFMIQIPGVSPEWAFRELVRRLDDRINVDDAILSGLPSIVAMNAMTQVSTGNPQNDPSQQGGRGANNAPQVRRDTSNATAAPLSQGGK